MVWCFIYWHGNPFQKTHIIATAIKVMYMYLFKYLSVGSNTAQGVFSKVLMTSMPRTLLSNTPDMSTVLDDFINQCPSQGIELL